MSKPSFTPSLLWQHSIATLKGLGPQARYISFFWFLVPQFIFSLFFAELSVKFWADLGGFGANSGSTPSIFGMIPTIQEHAMTAMLGLALLASCYLVGFASLLHLAKSQYMGATGTTSVQLFRTGISAAPKLAFMTILCLFVAAIAGSIAPPFILLTLTLVFAPANRLFMDNGVISCIGNTLTLQFAKNLPAGRMAVFLHALATCSVVYICFFIANFFAQLDVLLRTNLTSVQRTSWLVDANSYISPALTQLSTLLATCFVALAVAVLAAFSVSSCGLVSASRDNQNTRIHTKV